MDFGDLIKKYYIEESHEDHSEGWKFGVYRPMGDAPGKPYLFVKLVSEYDENLYSMLNFSIAELTLKKNNVNWLALVLFRDETVDGFVPEKDRRFAEDPRITKHYLNNLPAQLKDEPLFRLLRLVASSEDSMMLLKLAINDLKSGKFEPGKEEDAFNLLMQIITTKFPSYSADDIIELFNNDEL